MDLHAAVLLAEKIRLVPERAGAFALTPLALTLIAEFMPADAGHVVTTVLELDVNRAVSARHPSLAFGQHRHFGIGQFCATLLARLPGMSLALARATEVFAASGALEVGPGPGFSRQL